MPRAHLQSQPDHVPQYGLYELTFGFYPGFSNPFPTRANGIEAEVVRPSGRVARRRRTARSYRTRHAGAECGVEGRDDPGIGMRDARASGQSTGAQHGDGIPESDRRGMGTRR